MDIFAPKVAHLARNSEVVVSKGGLIRKQADGAQQQKFHFVFQVGSVLKFWVRKKVGVCLKDVSRCESM